MNGHGTTPVHTTAGSLPIGSPIRDNDTTPDAPTVRRGGHQDERYGAEDRR